MSGPKECKYSRTTNATAGNEEKALCGVPKTPHPIRKTRTTNTTTGQQVGKDETP